MTRTGSEQADDAVPVLETRALVKDYVTAASTVRALDGVDLEIRRGAFVSVMGPSGSGKSTLLHLLGGLDSPTAGSVLLSGRPLSGLPDRDLTLARRRRIGFVFQFFNLVPVLSVEENVALPAVIEGTPPARYTERLDTLLELTGLAGHRSHLPSQISGGQQQRVAIARALFARPEVLLADEPTGNLDTHTGHEILALLRDAQRSLGQTIVVVTHDAHIAGTGDEIVYLRDGRVGGHLDLRAPARSRRTTAARGSSAATRSGKAGTGKASARRSAKTPRAAPAATTRSSPRRSGGGDDRAQAVLAWLQELEA